SRRHEGGARGALGSRGPHRLGLGADHSGVGGGGGRCVRVDAGGPHAALRSGDTIRNSPCQDRRATGLARVAYCVTETREAQMGSMIATALIALLLAPIRQQVEQYRQANEARIVRELAELVSIPNLASDGPNIARNTQRLLDMLARRGIAA